MTIKIEKISAVEIGLGRTPDGYWAVGGITADRHLIEQVLPLIPDDGQFYIARIDGAILAVSAWKGTTARAVIFNAKALQAGMLRSLLCRTEDFPTSEAGFPKFEPFNGEPTKKFNIRSAATASNVDFITVAYRHGYAA